MRYYSNSFVAAQRWLHGRALVVSALLVAGLFALLVILLTAAIRDPATDQPAPLRLVDVAPEPLEVPPPPPVIEPEPVPASDIGAPAGGTPLPAPAPRLSLPEPMVRLPVEQLSSAPTSFATSPFDGLGVGKTNGLGGSGNVSGTGDGSGTGRGGEGGEAGVKLTVRWAPGMNHAAIFQRHYPKRAKSARTAGAARLVCEALTGDRVRNCQLIDEYPAGWGFGQAALAASPEYRVQVVDQDGKRVYGRDVRIGVEFMPRNPRTPKGTTAAKQFHKVPKEAAN